MYENSPDHIGSSSEVKATLQIAALLQPLQ